MFYLLEDNRIIDSNNFPYEWKFYTVLISEKDEKIILHCRDPRERKKYEIKKQSENVFDLIDWEEDLVKSRMNNMIWQCYVLNQISDISEQIKYKTIIAIYKPNSKGDYIKVWEKKDNEVE